MQKKARPLISSNNTNTIKANLTIWSHTILFFFGFWESITTFCYNASKSLVMKAELGRLISFFFLISLKTPVFKWQFKLVSVMLIKCKASCNIKHYYKNKKMYEIKYLFCESIWDIFFRFSSMGLTILMIHTFYVMNIYGFASQLRNKRTFGRKCVKLNQIQFHWNAEKSTVKRLTFLCFLFCFC